MQQIEYAATAFNAPHVRMRPHLGIDGNMYSFLYGDNIMEGIAGFGETVALAAADFDKNWNEKKLTPQGCPKCFQHKPGCICVPF